MPTLHPETLRQVGYDLFEAAGCLPEDAQAVTDHLVESSLFGHDSHGAIRYAEYANALRNGPYQPRATPVIVRENPCTAVVDAQGALGQIGGNFAMNLAMEKARQYGTSTVVLRNTSHVGRAGAYALMAARSEMMGLVFVNAGRLGYQIAPFGGIDGRLSTNPIAFSAPRRDENPLLIDMTTSVVAEGKIRVAINAGKEVPEGWIIDSQGNPTTHPRAFKADPPGAILPMGGVVAYKGYGLSFVVELLGGALSGQGCAAGETKMVSNGVLFTVYNIEHFTELETFYKEIEDLIVHVKSSRVAPGFSEILSPGEPEFLTAERKSTDGITIDETTWGAICDEARAVGLNPDTWLD